MGRGPRHTWGHMPETQKSFKTHTCMVIAVKKSPGLFFTSWGNGLKVISGKYLSQKQENVKPHLHVSIKLGETAWF